MEGKRSKKDYVSPECDMVRLLAFDVLNSSGNVPEGEPGEDIDENQGVWIS